MYRTLPSYQTVLRQRGNDSCFLFSFFLSFFSFFFKILISKFKFRVLGWVHRPQRDPGPRRTLSRAYLGRHPLPANDKCQRGSFSTVLELCVVSYRIFFITSLPCISQVSKVGQYSKAMQYLQQICLHINCSPKLYRARFIHCVLQEGLRYCRLSP